MAFVTLPEARLHLRHDSGTSEDDLITLWLGVAEAQVVEFLNRNVYADADALATAQAAAATALEAAQSAYTAALDTYSALTYDDERRAKVGASAASMAQAMADYRATIEGMVVNESVKAATLLLVGYLFETRSTDAPMPSAVRSLLAPYRVNMGI